MINAQPGVDKAEVNYATQSVKVSYHPAQIQPSAFQKAVQAIGYDLILDVEMVRKNRKKYSGTTIMR
ncbi:cation transporter [Pedobacter fastidiosus]|uniref:cation transporter n=1 Tax=Pedobacter fastidiosus TaxID=2765361 RepID=UPI00361EDFC7